ncbi:MAG: HEAT repeat domain-containing protein [Planctomycetes bacterium]|nr:HEAT repeat domain-containing protein [Planctomycetota bacterium]
MSGPALVCLLSRILCVAMCAIVAPLPVGGQSAEAIPPASKTELGPRAQTALEELVKAIDVQDRSRLVDASSEIRSLEAAKQAVPLLVKQLKSDNAGWRASILSALALLGSDASDAVPAIIELHDLTNETVYIRAIKALGEIGAPAVPALQEALRGGDTDLRTFAMSAIGRVGKAAQPAVPQLIELLEQKATTKEQKRERRSAAVALGNIGSVELRAIGALTRALKDKDERLREFACHSLAQIGDLPEDSVLAVTQVFVKDRPVTFTMLQDATLALRRSGMVGQVRLVEALEIEDDYVRLLVAKALGRIGPGARGAIPELRKRLMDSSESVRMEAALALWAIDGQAEVAVANLVKGLDGSDIWAGWVAADYLRRMGPDAKGSVPALLDIVENGDGDERPYAVLALSSIGAEANAVPVLVDAVLSKDGKDASSNVTEALARIGPMGVDALVKMLSHENRIVRHAAAIGLCEAGVHGISAVPALRRFAEKESNKNMRDDAKEAMKHIMWAKIGWTSENMPELLKAIERDPSVREMMATLLGAPADRLKETLVRLATKQIENLIRDLKSDVGHKREFAAQGLGRLGPLAADCIDSLRAALKDEAVTVRIEAAAALWKITGKSDEALPVLRGSLRHPSDDVRHRAASSLFEIGPLAKPTVPLLAEMLKDDNPELRLAAARALVRVEPGHEQLLPTLSRLLDERFADTHRETCEVLGMLGPRAKPAIPALKRCRVYQFPNSLDESTRALRNIRGPKHGQ